MTTDADRGTGFTSRQIKAAPQRAIFVWCNADLSYPRELARKLGRDDIEIVAPDWLNSDRWRGRELTGIIIDHATRLSGSTLRGYEEAITRVRILT